MQWFTRIVMEEKLYLLILNNYAVFAPKPER